MAVFSLIPTEPTVVVASLTFVLWGKGVLLLDGDIRGWIMPSLLNLSSAANVFLFVMSEEAGLAPRVPLTVASISPVNPESPIEGGLWVNKFALCSSLEGLGGLIAEGELGAPEVSREPWTEDRPGRTAPIAEAPEIRGDTILDVIGIAWGPANIDPEPAGLYLAGGDFALTSELPSWELVSSARSWDGTPCLWAVMMVAYNNIKPDKLYLMALHKERLNSWFTDRILYIRCNK